MGRRNATEDCRSDKTVCHTGDNGRSTCAQTCQHDELCFPGTKCTTIAINKRRRRTRLQKLCLPVETEE